jgi:5-hydroxyisourate hydrolase
MGRLTTHVLDTTRGQPGSHISVTLYQLEGEQRQSIKTVVTNDDGRCDEPLLENDQFVVGIYELVFSVGPYFTAQESAAPDQPNVAAPRFLDDVVIRFGVSASDQHYHVPLLITPYSYSTYRGS